MTTSQAKPVLRIYALPGFENTPLSRIREDHNVAIFTQPAAWSALNGTLNVNEVWRAEPTEASEAHFASLAREMPDQVEVIYAVGGGLAFDAAKYAALQHSLPLAGVPTAISVDAFLTPASGVRRDGFVSYVETGAAQVLYLDWELLAAAPAYIRAAGVADVISIATALWDWHFAESEGKLLGGGNVIPFIARIARDILDEAVLLAPRLGRGEIAALQRLLSLLAIEVQLCNLIGHSRAEEGSEHYFAYAVENVVGSGLPHGELVGPGIVAIAAAQEQNWEPLRDALDQAGIALESVPWVAAEATLRSLPDYAARNHLPFGIAHVLSEEQVERGLRAAW
ncbi:MAG: iron-containing alcohol dehydrogenase [Dehalococcoidia bacterium]